MIGGGLTAGPLLDREYKVMRKKYDRAKEADVEKTGEKREGAVVKQSAHTEDDFKIERARMRTMPIFMAVFIASLVGYGWCLQSKVNMSAPLILQFLRECHHWSFWVV